MVLWMGLLMSAPHQASAVELWVGAGVRERVFACFLAGVTMLVYISAQVANLSLDMEF